MGWVVVFTAILGHLPALAGYFAGPDWGYLARVAHEGTGGWEPRPLTRQFTWQLVWPFFAVQAPPYHGLALLLAAALAFLTVRMSRRLGLPLAGQAVAGLVVAGSPVVVGPIYWAARSGELWTAVFALVSLELWLQRRPELLLVATLAGVLVTLGDDSGLLWPLVLVAATRITRLAWSPLRAGLVSVVTAASLAEVWLLANAGEWGPNNGLNGSLTDALSYGGWLVSPWTFGRGSDPGLQFAGLAVIAWWAVTAFRAADLPTRLGGLLAVLSLMPRLFLKPEAIPGALTLAVVGWGLFLGARLAPTAETLLARARTARPGSWGALALLVAAGVVGTVAWTATQARLTERGPEGILVDPMARSHAASAEGRRLLSQLPRSSRGYIRILQATRIEVSEDFEPPEGEEFVFDTPLHRALGGETGVSLMLPEGAHITWTSHLDDLPPRTQVLLDAGDYTLRPLGTVENARMYSALIATAAGQFDRARHDLWAVTGREGYEVPFHFDADVLPITEDELNAQVADFVTFLQAGTEPIDRRILLLFEQLYEAVTGKDLYRTPWGGTLKG